MGNILGRTIQVAGFDSAFAHWGMAEAHYDIETGDLNVFDLELINTEKGKGKTVRKNSDDLRRSKEILERSERVLTNASFFAAEVPSGAQSARAAFTFGTVVGLLASLDRPEHPLIQVSPIEAKLASVGRKTATKDEIIEWAYRKYPALPWLRNSNSKRASRLTDANEHLADAIAILHAMIKTDQFRLSLSMLRSIRSGVAA